MLIHIGERTASKRPGQTQGQNVSVQQTQLMLIGMPLPVAASCFSLGTGTTYDALPPPFSYN